MRYEEKPTARVQNKNSTVPWNVITILDENHIFMATVYLAQIKELWPCMKELFKGKCAG